MKRLLIADDEPLVQIGIKSMLPWETLDIELCGIASDGEQALRIIEESSPEIVITDIRMPVMNGMELIRTCSSRFGRLPVFLVLTSYEEYPLVKEAIHYQVIDYLIKLELDSESLCRAVQKAITRVQELTLTERSCSPQTISQNYSDKFYLRLLYNLFDSREQFQLQSKELKLQIEDRPCLAAYCEICESGSLELTHQQLSQLYESSLQMIYEILNRYASVHIVSLDHKHLAVIFYEESSTPKTSGGMETVSEKALEDASSITHMYFNITLRTGIGTLVESPLFLHESFQEAREALHQSSETVPVRRFMACRRNSPGNAFNLTLFKKDIIHSFEEFDTDILYRSLTDIIELFRAHPDRYLQAIDGACNIMFLAISLLPDGEACLTELFDSSSGSYRSIYRCSNTEQVTEWMIQLRNGLCTILKSRRKTYKDHIITNVKHYIKEHIEERLVLNEISDMFGISHNYLSILFKKSCGIGFSEYVTQTKISRSKIMLLDENLKIYEAADRLGFESACYFSKVFKKVEGISPREFLNENIAAPEEL